MRCPFSRSTREMTCWHDSLASSHVLHTRPFCGILSRELLANCTNLLLMLDSSLISYTHPLQLNPHKYKKMIEEFKIKFGTELKPTKASWKSQLYIIDFNNSMRSLLGQPPNKLIESLSQTHEPQFMLAFSIAISIAKRDLSSHKDNEIHKVYPL